MTIKIYFNTYKHLNKHYLENIDNNEIFARSRKYPKSGYT